MKKIVITSVLLAMAFVHVSAQGFRLKTQVVDTKGTPISGAVIEAQGAEASVLSDSEGYAEIVFNVENAIMNVSCTDFFPVEYPVSEKTQLSKIILIPKSWVNYTEELVLPYGPGSTGLSSTSAASVGKKDMGQALTLDKAMQGQLAGLQVLHKSGMPGEGAYINLGGVHSLTAENTPLVVINGVPSLADNTMSYAINGYSRSIFGAYNINDIKNITVLTGADASVYGSLGSNGVILIETEQAKSNNLDTRISLSGQYGLNFKGQTISVLESPEYKNYLRSVGMTRYSQMGLLTADYPFLQTSTDYASSTIFNNNTNWQNEIYGSGFSTNNVFRVEGGDEIAKYNISVGYSSDGGTVKDTYTDRYHTLINSNILVTRQVDIFTMVSLAYMHSKLQEQGMSAETNPLLASYYNLPVLNPYQCDDQGRLIDVYAPYNYSNVNSNPTYAYENISNPTAIVNTLDVTDKMYDVNIQMGLNYQVNPYLKLTGLFNLCYRYTEENVFIPGMTNQAIYPQYYGIGRNTVRMGVAEARSRYYGVNADYRRTFDYVHELGVSGGVRLMSTTSEYDITSGYNTANDFYQTLDQLSDEVYGDGYNNEWVWLNAYAHADYTYNRLLKASLNVSLDGSSVSGVDAPRYYAYPSGGLTFMAANLDGMPAWVNRLNLNAEYGFSGNSRFSSNYAKNYYLSSNYFTLGSIVRSDIPNTLLEPEKKRQLDLGASMSFFGHRLSLGVNYFDAYAYDLLITQSLSSVYASSKYYDNSAEISTKGLVLSARVVPVETKDFSWTLGGSLTTTKSLVEKLGEQDELSIKYTDYADGEDAVMKLVVGESPYQFYGYKTKGIYATTAEAQASGLTSIYDTPYQGGDVIFVNQDENKVINEKDKVLLGSATPDYFGSFFTSFRYKNFTLNAQFNYSVGNKAYNAVRRSLESMDNFHNQSTAVLNRWQVEGQQTTMPRASYGDPHGNNVFSDRWIEDASYLKMGALTLSYNINKPIAKFFRSGTLWVSGENLLTFTDYLGSDPELAYSYDECLKGFDYGKIANPLSVKVGFNLNF